MNIFNDIQEAYWQYQHDWGVIPNLLFMNAHDYHQSIKNVEVGMPNIMFIHEIARNTFLGCEVFLINNPTFKGVQFRELNDLLTAIKHERGYLSGDIKVYKHKPLDIDYSRPGTDKADPKVAIPIERHYVVIDQLAAMVFIKRKSMDNVNKMLSPRRVRQKSK